MSNIGKILGGALIVLLIGGVILAVTTLAIMWLVPIATAGVIHLGFIQTVAIITLATIAGWLLNAVNR